MNGDGARLWTDRSCLQQVQYRTDANLAARQSIYAYQHPRIDLPAAVLDLAALRGDETIADVGCGNGAYLAVPDPLAAVRELRRVTRPDGHALVVLNGGNHLRELRDLIAAALQITTSDPLLGDQLRLDDGQELTAGQSSWTVRRRSRARTPERRRISAGQGANPAAELLKHTVGSRWLSLAGDGLLRTCCGLSADRACYVITTHLRKRPRRGASTP